MELAANFLLSWNNVGVPIFDGPQAPDGLLRPNAKYLNKVVAADAIMELY
jgi:hypothetical protein